MMSMLNMSRIFGVSFLFLGAGALLGCHEPNQSNANDELKSPPQEGAGSSSGAKLESLVTYRPGEREEELNTCNIEAANGSSFQDRKVAVSRDKPVHFEGWVAAIDRVTPKYVLRFENKASSLYYQAPLVPAVERPDVAATIGEKAKYSGFAVDVNVEHLPVADYHVYLAVSDDKGLGVCDNGRTVAITP
jgi:hypothetical protein